MIGKEKVFIIAEAGVNHNGSIDLAKQLIDAAKWAGVDAVKFQTWKTENIIVKQAEKPQYQKDNEIAGKEENQFDMLKRLELPYEDFITLKQYCDAKQIVFMSTADEYESASFLNPLQKAIKVGSAELTDWPFLQKIARFGKPVLLSTGMGTLAEIVAAINIMVAQGLPKENIIALHANTEYPTSLEDANLRAMKTMREELEIEVGYSDHTLGSVAAIAAVAMGARVIEKHFTLDRDMDGPDHKASITAEELKKMVEDIRKVELALGTGEKKPSKSELKNIPFVRKSIVAKKTIKAGEFLTVDNITVKRPGLGISPIYWNDIIGHIATRNYNIDDIIVEPINRSKSAGRIS
jgi:N-acetylneuraminate synthase